MATPTAIKRLSRSNIVRGAVCWLGAQYVRLVWATGGWREINREIPERFRREGQACIVCFWHGRLLMMPCAKVPEDNFHMLISQHPDGQIIARTVGHFGIDTVEGSTTRGGTGAVRAIRRVLDDGGWVGVTPDGPRGPRMRASIGAINLARLSGVSILPLAFSTKRGRVLGSWDRFMLPFPFSKGALVWGDPIDVDRDMTDDALEAIRLELEKRLTAVTDQADEICGRLPIEPAPIGAEARP